MQDFEISLLCVLWDKILERFDATSKTLQKIEIELATCVHLYERKRYFEETTTQTEFQDNDILLNFRFFDDRINEKERSLLQTTEQVMQMFQESRPQPVTHSGEIRLHWGLINDLKFQFEQLVIAMKGIVIPDKTQPRHQQLFTRLHEMVSCYTNPNLKNRAKRYETTNTLYQTLNQNEILDLLKANHATVRELILTNDPNAGVPSIPVPQEVRGESIPTITTHRKVIPFILRIVYSGIKLKLVIAILFSSLILIRFLDR